MSARELKLTTTIDLTSFCFAEKTVTGWLVLDERDTPIALCLLLPDITPATLSALCNFDKMAAAPVNGQTISGVVEDGRFFQTRLEFITRMQPIIENGFSAVITAMIQDTEFWLDGVTAPIATWRFPLANVRIRRCDVMTTGSLSSDGTSTSTGSFCRLDKIPLELGGRPWVLTDLTVASAVRDPTQHEQHIPLMTATLETVVQSDDTLENVRETAYDICHLLSIALARHVALVTTLAVDSEGRILRQSSPVPNLTPYNQHGEPAVDNWESGCLRRFMEKAWTVFLTDPKWFRLTLEYLRYARVGGYLDARTVFLNILADRISTRVRGSGTGYEIDSQLKEKMESREFQAEIEGVFEKITPHWTSDRTRALINQVNQWNSGPSFSKGIRRACRALRLPEPSGKFLATRHKLLHECELDPHDGDVVQYWFDLDWLVLAMVLRLLNYEGLVYHHQLGAAAVSLGSLLTPIEADKDNPTALDGREGIGN